MPVIKTSNVSIFLAKLYIFIYIKPCSKVDPLMSLLLIFGIITLSFSNNQVQIIVRDITE